MDEFEHVIKGLIEINKNYMGFTDSKEVRNATVSAYENALYIYNIQKYKGLVFDGTIDSEDGEAFNEIFKNNK